MSLAQTSSNRGKTWVVISTTLLVVFDGEGWFSCWQRTETAWKPLSRFQIPPAYEPELRDLQGMHLSDSGRFLLLDILGETRQALLLEAKTGQIKASIPLTLSPWPCFETLPDGMEILFLSAPSYMGVQMIDCASGRLLHSFVPRSGWDFCHVSYQLSKDATRLLTFGCVWAGPYEMRLYDATPWTFSAKVPNAPQGFFALSEIFRQEEVFCGADTVLPSRFLFTEDSHALVERATAHEKEENRGYCPQGRRSVSSLVPFEPGRKTDQERNQAPPSVAVRQATGEQARRGESCSPCAPFEVHLLPFCEERHGTDLPALLWHRHSQENDRCLCDYRDGEGAAAQRDSNLSDRDRRAPSTH